MLHIKVDHRECNGDLLAALRQDKNNLLEICRLPVGDYQVGDLLVVERKTIPDLAVSIQDGRWFLQAVKLSGTSIRSLVILEGTSLNYQNLGMKRETIQGALITLSLLFKIPLLRSRSPEETARLMVYAAGQMGKFGTRAGPVRHFPIGQRRSSKKRKQMHVLQGFTGIGPQRAQLLLEKFGSLKAIFTAFNEDTAAIPGIGKKTINRIKELLE